MLSKAKASPRFPQMNFYERSLEKMRESMEVERKDISQAFKVRKRLTET